MSLGYQEPHRSDSRRPLVASAGRAAILETTESRRKPSWTSTSLDSMCVGAQVEAAKFLRRPRMSWLAVVVAAATRGGFRRRYRLQPSRTALVRVPPIPPSAMLYWPAPPLSHPTTIAVTNDNPRLYLEPDKDYIIQLPATPVTAEGGVWVVADGTLSWSAARSSTIRRSPTVSWPTLHTGSTSGTRRQPCTWRASGSTAVGSGRQSFCLRPRGYRSASALPP